MMRQVQIRPRAEADIKEQFQYFARISTELAVRFSTQVDSTFQALLKAPDQGINYSSVHDAATDLRISKVQQFPNHLVMYRVTGTGIDVVRILHRARDLDSLFESGELT